MSFRLVAQFVNYLAYLVSHGLAQTCSMPFPAISRNPNTPSLEAFASVAHRRLSNFLNLLSVRLIPLRCAVIASTCKHGKQELNLSHSPPEKPAFAQVLTVVRGEVLDSCSGSSLSGYLPQHLGRHAAAPDAAGGRCDVPLDFRGELLYSTLGNREEL